jgi:hypothetical protein
MKPSATESLAGYELKQLKIIRSKQAGSIAMVAESKSNGDNLNIRRDTSRTFRNKKREYLKEKINKLETSTKNKSIRDLQKVINEFKTGY